MVAKEFFFNHRHGFLSKNLDTFMINLMTKFFTKDIFLKLSKLFL